MPQVEVIVEPGGKTVINGIGFAGSQCVNVLSQIAACAGSHIESIENHPELALEDEHQITESG